MEQGEVVGYGVVRTIPDWDDPVNEGREVPVSFKSYTPVIGMDPDTGRVELPIFTAHELATRFVEDHAVALIERPDEGQMLTIVGMTAEKIVRFAQTQGVTHIRSYGTSGYSTLTTWPGGQFVERTPIE